MKSLDRRVEELVEDIQALSDVLDGVAKDLVAMDEEMSGLAVFCGYKQSGVEYESRVEDNGAAA